MHLLIQLKTYKLDVSNREAKNEETLENLYVFRSFYLLFFSYFATCQRKENDWHSSFSYKKNAFPLYLYPFIVFHISVWSERFLDKFALLELRISPIRYFVFHNCIMYPKYYMKIIVPFWPFIVYANYITKQMNFIELLKKHFPNFTTGEICSSSRATLYKKPSDTTVHKYFCQIVFLPRSCIPRVIDTLQSIV